MKAWQRSTNARSPGTSSAPSFTTLRPSTWNIGHPSGEQASLGQRTGSGYSGRPKRPLSETVGAQLSRRGLVRRRAESKPGEVLAGVAAAGGGSDGQVSAEDDGVMKNAEGVDLPAELDR